MINLCITFLPSDKIYAIPADTGKVIKPTPVIDRVEDVDVAPIKTIVATDSNILFRDL